MIPSHYLGYKDPSSIIHRSNPKFIILDSQNTPRKIKIYALSQEAALTELFRLSDFRLHDVRTGKIMVPRLLFWQIPWDLSTISNIQLRKKLFIKIVLPLILEQNALILEHRSRLLALKDHDFSKLSYQEKIWVSKLATYYKVNIHKTSDNPISADTISELLEKVNIIPVPIALAQAAIETGWGTSRFALRGNALFGQWTWQTTGIKPNKRLLGKTHSIKAFKRLADSVADYSQNLNSSPFYVKFRLARSQFLNNGRYMEESSLLVQHISSYSQERLNYVKKLTNIISTNNLEDFETISPQLRSFYIEQPIKSPGVISER